VQHRSHLTRRWEDQDAHLSIEESVPNLVNVLLKKQGNAKTLKEREQ
jgi:hypothetical protein